MAKDNQGVSGLNKLVDQADLPANASSVVTDAKQTYQAPKPGSTTTNRSSMRLVDQAKVPGGDPKGRG